MCSNHNNRNPRQQQSTQKPQGNSGESKEPTVRSVRRGQSFTAKSGDVVRALPGSNVTGKKGSTVIFEPGSAGVAMDGCNYTAKGGSVITARFGSIGRAMKGATIVADYGAIFDQEEGVTVIRRADEETHTVTGSHVSSYGELSDMEKSLVDQAWQGAERAYCPYSNFPVGAAILAENETGEQQVFVGCNVENASYGGTICAERTAAVKAVSAGYRKFLIISVVCKKHPGGSPCGFCRQVLREFGKEAMVLNIFNTDNVVVRWTVAQLLPDSFGPDSL